MAIGKWGQYQAKYEKGYSFAFVYNVDGYLSTDTVLYSSYTIASNGTPSGVGTSSIIAPGLSGYTGFAHLNTGPHGIRCYSVKPKDQNPSHQNDYPCSWELLRGEPYNYYSKSTFIQNVTATTGTYPANGRHTDGFWYVYIGLVPPNAPPTLTVPATITGGKSSSISWGQATTEGAAISGYELHRSLDNGTFAQVYRGANLTFADTVPYGTNTVQYSVRSYDVDNQKSVFKVGEVKNVINNNPPVITCIATDMGEIDTGFTVQYSVSDEDIADTITVTEAIDNVVLRSFSATRGIENTADVTALTWLRLLNGLHTLTITAVDNRGGTVVKFIKFTKDVHEIEFELTTPLSCDAAVTKAMMQMLAVVPAGALVQIFACNNGFDEAPTWVDVTLKVLNNEKIFFANEVKTAENWGYNVRVHIDRNGAQGDCFITSIGGNFE